VSTDSLFGTMALFLVKAGERGRALRVFDAVPADAENYTSDVATLTDPSGALRAATRSPGRRSPSHEREACRVHVHPRKEFRLFSP
jgi:hypothetical protein